MVTEQRRKGRKDGVVLVQQGTGQVDIIEWGSKGE